MNLLQFTHSTPPAHVAFGRGTHLQVAALLKRLEVSRPLCLWSDGSARAASAVLEGLAAKSLGPVATSDRTRMHVPQALAVEHVQLARTSGADSLVAVGGGSVIGLAKAVALSTGLPIVSVPTTYSGSEMTDVWGMTHDGVKRTGRDRRVLPSAVAYDPGLTDELPRTVTGLSGLNAVAHAVEATYAEDTSPLVALIAEEAIHSMTRSLGGLAEEGTEADRDLALYASWLCGMSLSLTTMGLHHKLCHLLGGRFDAPHAATHALVLPFVVRYLDPWLPPEQRDILYTSVGGQDPAAVLTALARSFDAPTSLRDLCVDDSDVASLTHELSTTLRPMAAPTDEDHLYALLRALYLGELDALGPGDRPGQVPLSGTGCLASAPGRCYPAGPEKVPTISRRTNDEP